MRVESSKMTVIDLFSGCGGIALGLWKSGWRGIFAVEKNPFAFATLKHNLIEKKQHFDWPAWLPVAPHDINELLSTYIEELRALQGTVDLVAGGPPCQGFSMAGKRIESDERNSLVFSYIEFIKIVKPKMILFENVKGFTCPFKSGKEGKAFSHIVINKLQEIGYNVSSEIIDFSEYGVPQRRKRFILVGTLSSERIELKLEIDKLKIDFLKKKGLKEKVTVREAISDLLMSNGMVPTPDRLGFNSGVYGKIMSDYQTYMRQETHSCFVDSHSYANHQPQTIDLFSKIIQNCKPGVRIGGCDRVRFGIKKRGITLMDADGVSPTLTSHPDDYVHYCESRILTVREYARLQTFPDWFEFKKKYTTGGSLRKVEVPRYTQIANAVPPLFAELVGLCLANKKSI